MEKNIINDRLCLTVWFYWEGRDLLSTINVVFGMLLIKMIATSSLAGVTVHDAQEEESQNWQTLQVCELKISSQLRRNDSRKMTKFLIIFEVEFV